MDAAASDADRIAACCELAGYDYKFLVGHTFDSVANTAPSQEWPHRGDGSYQATEEWTEPPLQCVERGSSMFVGTVASHRQCGPILQLRPCIKNGVPGVVAQVPSAILPCKRPVWVILMLASKKMCYHSAPPPPPELDGVPPAVDEWRWRCEIEAEATAKAAASSVQETAAVANTAAIAAYRASHTAHVYNPDGSRIDGLTNLSRDQYWLDLQWDYLPKMSEARGSTNFYYYKDLGKAAATLLRHRGLKRADDEGVWWSQFRQS